MLKWIFLLPQLIRLILLAERTIAGAKKGTLKKEMVLEAITETLKLLLSAGVLNANDTSSITTQVNELIDLLVDFFNRHQVFKTR